MIISGWCDPYRLLLQEIIQTEEEGRIVPESVRREVSMLHPEQDAWSERISVLMQKLSDAPTRPDWRYEEPDDLESILRLRPEGPRKLELSLSDSEMMDRFHGAWRGRSVGCALGKPVECKSRKWIRELLVRQGDWELKDFVRGGDPDLWCPRSQRENITCMEPDDDIRYTLIGLLVMEKLGADFLWFDIADCWNEYLPYNAICTAETQAILNYNLRRPRIWEGKGGAAATPEFTRRYNNPFREWIGAAIRADFWGYAAAGNPELAAGFAYRDACWTHSKNGIYSEMFIAAVIAAAFAEPDPVKLIEIGLSEIPANCRLAEAVRLSLAWKKSGASWEEWLDKLDSTYASMHDVHAINNLQIVLMALLYGGGTIDRSAALAVMGGKDTDCNGATIGSIVGVINPESKLAGRLNETIAFVGIGEGRFQMKELAERTFRVWKKLQAAGN